MVQGGTGSEACWAQTVHIESRERFPDQFGLNERDQEMDNNGGAVNLDHLKKV